MKIIIPAYEPSEKFLDLIKRIKDLMDMEIIIVDDGSGEKYQEIFKAAEKLGCNVLRHNINLGKGTALKTAFLEVINSGDSEGVVCVDCDGQHSPEDIQNIAKNILNYKDRMILGVRKFVGKVPFRSMIGNKIIRKIFELVTGNYISDTQTGLRGYPSFMLPWLCSIEGERFEYELNLLLKVKESGYKIIEIPIDTIYDGNNKGSHFRPLLDSIRVFIPMIKFSAVSLLSGVLDFVLLLGIEKILGNLFVAVFLSRLCSSLFNYGCNRNLVFNSKGKVNSFVKYYFLVLVVLVCNYVMMSLFTSTLMLPLVLSKVITEAILFLFSYISQRKFVFN
ncbi:bifunctional glycosyltransferase family 2/GtrA family protein [Clostridium cellulovorans]|uniref:Glycosyl transferase family 2 n=2 Tax=Clostridium cellulovorans TaxID=1493 RepID=D9SPX8_CLOC7|nr:bifunctional glycosyltransferase family 2/GtrA family protein [Clostridium cellulovorans]ADL52114.1 glycosyl transferase family 2 [Clostridium cellulovorans 743B]BAV13184.1 glycosyltransferases involved in cell wall biogenesis [Clostridium cellulovorans]